MNFRNIDASTDDPVESWGFEGVLAAFERGGLEDWHKLYVACKNDRRGDLRETVEEALGALEQGDVRPQLAEVFRLALAGCPG